MGALGPPLALLAGTAVQVIGRVLAGADRPDLGVRGVGAATALEWFDGVVVAVLRPGHPPPVVYGTVSLALAVSVAVVVAVALVPKLRTSTTAIAPGTAASMIVITAGLGIVMWFTLAFQVGMAVRYGVPTTLFLITSLIVAIDFALDARPDLVARVPATFLLVTFAIATVFAWPPSDLRDEVDRSWSQAIDDARGTCLATSDQWALLPTTPRGWTVYVSCRELLEDP